MLDSINIGIAGMNAFSNALKTISNNVANMNTLGFKSKTSTFSDLVNSGRSAGGTLQSGTYKQFGTGVSYNSTMLNFKAGDLKTTNGALDIALNGAGFFVLQNDSGKLVYARTGQFELKDGKIVEVNSGFKLMVRNSLGAIVAATTKGLEAGAPKPTTVVSFSGNLRVDGQADATIPTVNVIDSLGGSHALTMSFGDVVVAANGNNTRIVTIKDSSSATVGTGTLEFSSTDGLGTIVASTAKVTVAVTAVGGKSSASTFDFSNVFGANPTASSASITAGTPDGHAAGSISSVVATSAGTMEINYTSGDKVALGDIVIANFVNLQDLQQTGSGHFDYTGTDSPIYGISGTEGMGTLQTGSLEGSNVNLSEEFGDLILVQRGFQASSQIISTANEMIGHVFELRSQR